MKTNKDYSHKHFEELSHAAWNIVLTAQNDYDVYKNLGWLHDCIVKRVRANKSINFRQLVDCSTLKSVVGVAAYKMRVNGFDDAVTSQDRFDARVYLAYAVIDGAVYDAIKD
jgi:hypothetical protein